MKNYEVIIGLEIHVELSTKSKMFCSCSADYFGTEPNTHTCPVCLGLPGALPFANKTAIDSCVKIALALNCKINNKSHFDRKNYFYPDLPKGFQISQYKEPFGEKGSIFINGKEIEITRVHMEEDTGKIIHSTVDGTKVSLLDFNRSGVPLVEIVTEPDIKSGEEAKLFLTELQKIIRYLGVSDADMEKGHMRLEPNISVREIGKTDLPKYKVEVKNINSFKFVGKAIDFEIERQVEILEKGETPKQETRGWSEGLNATVSQRSKEEAHDYRYFPEPDLPPVELNNEQIKILQEEVGELPLDKKKRFQKSYEIPEYDVDILTRGKGIADFFEEAVKAGTGVSIGAKTIANIIINKKVDIENKTPAELVREIYETSQKQKVNPEQIHEVINKVLEKNSKAVEDYKNGKIQVLGFLIGLVKKELPKDSDTSQIKEDLEKLLK